MFRWFGRNSPSQPDVSQWWTKAAAEALAPTEAGVEALRASRVSADTAPDVAEAQDEFLDGLASLLNLSRASALPTVDTQHRVIGSDVCHYLVPASLVDQVDAAGKLFVTSTRLIFAAGKVQAWSWPHIARIERVERDLLIDLRGRPPVQLRLNTYGDAMVAAALVTRLSRNPTGT